MDLNQFKDLTERHDQGIAVIIRNPETNEETDIVITVAGAWSNKAREAGRDMAALNVDHEGDPERFSQMLMARRVISWENLEMNGKPVPCTVADATELFTDPRFYWLYAQVIAVDRARVFQTPDRGSVPGRDPGGQARLSKPGRKHHERAPHRAPVTDGAARAGA
jgi:hypothetical protein